MVTRDSAFVSHFLHDRLERRDFRGKIAEQIEPGALDLLAFHGPRRPGRKCRRQRRACGPGIAWGQRDTGESGQAEGDQFATVEIHTELVSTGDGSGDKLQGKQVEIFKGEPQPRLHTVKLHQGAGRAHAANRHSRGAERIILNVQSGHELDKFADNTIGLVGEFVAERAGMDG